MTNYLNNISKPAVTLFIFTFLSVAAALTPFELQSGTSRSDNEDQVFTVINFSPDRGIFDLEQETENHEKYLPSASIRCFLKEKSVRILNSETFENEATKFLLFLVTQIDLPPPVC